MKSSRAAVATAAAFLITAASPAGAHEETALHALSVIDAVTPRITGLSFRVVQITQPVLYARNHTGRKLIVYGERGEPFLRLSRGRVETNINSSLTYVSRDPMGPHGAAPTDLDPTGPAKWSVLARRQSWSWFDPRIRFAGPDKHSWEVRARLGNQDVLITGSFESLTGHGHFDTAIEPPRSVTGLEIRLLDGLVPAMYVRNDTNRTLTVPGRRGEPFLEIGPRGVFANQRSPDYYMGGMQTVRSVPKSADPNAKPRWERVSEVPIWSWLEYRARLPATTHERSSLGPEPQTVLTWVTPLKLGGEALSLRGRVDWIPPRRPSTVQPPERGFGIWLSAAAAGLVVAVAAFAARRRKAALAEN